METREERLFSRLREIGALKEGHFLLASGLHSNRYVEKFDLLRRPRETADVCSGFVESFANARIDVVAGPTTGGMLLAYEVAKQLDVPAAYAERRTDGKSGREFRRGTTFPPGANVLVVDDILTTGGSVRDTLSALSLLDVSVAGVGVLVDRSGGEVRFADVPLSALLTLSVETWKPEVCPLCAEGRHVVKPGTTAPVM